MIRGWMILGVLLLAVGATAGLVGLATGADEYGLAVGAWLAALGTGSVAIEVALELERHRQK